MTKAITFTPTGWKGYASCVAGTLPTSGALLTIQAAQRLDEIDLTCLFNGHACNMRFTAADARAVAVALLQAADAVSAVHGGAA